MPKPKWFKGANEFMIRLTERQYVLLSLLAKENKTGMHREVVDCFLVGLAVKGGKYNDERKKEGVERGEGAQGRI